MGSDSYADNYESLATLLAVAIAVFAEVSNAKYKLRPVAEDEDSRRLKHLDVVHVRDRRERGRRQHSSGEAHTACSPLPLLRVVLNEAIVSVLTQFFDFSRNEKNSNQSRKTGL